MNNRSRLLASVLLAVPSLAWGEITSLDLGNYQLTATYPLPPVAASEASAVTYNWDTDSLFVLGDEGEAIVEVDRFGQQLSVMTLTGFDDTEGLTYLGAGSFALVEERIQDAFQLTYTPGGAVDRSALPTASLGETVGNVGLEGISFDPRTGDYVLVKEKTPQRVLTATIDFAAGSAVVDDLFIPDLGVLDLSDVQVLATVPSLLGTADEDNLLLYSQESRILLEVSRTGELLSQFSFDGIADNAEGVTIDQNGTIFVVGETPELFVLTPIPEPTTALLLIATAGLALGRRRR